MPACTPASGSLVRRALTTLTLRSLSWSINVNYSTLKDPSNPGPVEQDRHPDTVLHCVLGSRSVPQSILGVCDGRKGSF